MTDTLTEITTWHQRARPHSNNTHFNVQLGCHLEEIGEMLDTLIGADERTDDEIWNASEHIKSLGNKLKAGDMHTCVLPRNRGDFLDSLADQIVTAVGVGHCADMDVIEACKAVNFSNWSKFDHAGQPIFDANGKVTKGPGYSKPVLKGMY